MHTAFGILAIVVAGFFAIFTSKFIYHYTQQLFNAANAGEAFTCIYVALTLAVGILGLTKYFNHHPSIGAPILFLAPVVIPSVLLVGLIFTWWMGLNAERLATSVYQLGRKKPKGGDS